MPSHIEAMDPPDIGIGAGSLSAPIWLSEKVTVMELT